MMKNFLPKCILVLCIFSAFSKGAKSANNNETYNEIDTLTTLFYLDGNQVTFQELLNCKSNDSTFTSVDGAIDAKEAIFRFGEKARYGIIFFETENKDEDNSNN